MTPLLRYTFLRFTVLVAVGLVAYLLGARGILLIVVAFLGSGVVSLVLLSAPREDVARKLAERADPTNRRPRRGVFARINERIEAANRAEDEALDAAQQDDTPPDGGPADDEGGSRAS